MILFVVNIVGGAKHQMIMNVLMIRMGSKDIGIASLQKLICKLFSNLMCKFGAYLSGCKGLYKVKCLIRVGAVRMRQSKFEVLCSRFGGCPKG